MRGGLHLRARVFACMRRTKPTVKRKPAAAAAAAAVAEPPAKVAKVDKTKPEDGTVAKSSKLRGGKKPAPPAGGQMPAPPAVAPAAAAAAAVAPGAETWALMMGMPPDLQDYLALLRLDLAPYRCCKVFESLKCFRTVRREGRGRGWPGRHCSGTNLCPAECHSVTLPDFKKVIEWHSDKAPQPRD